MFAIKFAVFACALILNCCNRDAEARNLAERFWWRTLDYEYENEEARDYSIQSNEFIPENNVPFGIEIWKDKLFVTVPRRNPGVPSTLNYVSLNSNTTSPLLIPYPDWTANNLTTKFLISTYRVTADKCNRLWTIDTGSVVDFSGKGERILTPRIRIFDLIDDSLLVEYILKPEDYTCQASYISITVDVSDSCDNAFAYLVDPGSNSVLVYSLFDDESWRITHPYFRPDPLQTEYQIGDIEFQWDDGLFGFALGEKLNKGYRNVYFHPMSSLIEFSTTTDILQNKSIVTEPYPKNIFKILGWRAPTFQAAASAYDERNGILFYSLVGKNAIGCWNSKKYFKFNQDVTDIVASDDVRMIYFSEVKVDKEGNLWAISNRLPLILYTEFNPEDINFRIFTASIKQAVRSTICEPIKKSRPFWHRRI